MHAQSDMQFANGQVVTKVGDKLTSAHGQKGVVGARWPAADMPYMEDGTPMDAVMNPHAFPPRMFGGEKGTVLDGAGGIVITPNGSMMVHGHNVLEGNPKMKSCFTSSGGLQIGRAAQALSAGSVALGTNVIACVRVAVGGDASVGLGL